MVRRYGWSRSAGTASMKDSIIPALLLIALLYPEGVAPAEGNRLWRSIQ